MVEFNFNKNTPLGKNNTSFGHSKKARKNDERKKGMISETTIIHDKKDDWD